MYVEAVDIEKKPLVSMGDLNVRLGDLSSITEDYSFTANDDVRMNENGRHLKELLFNSTLVLPLNHLKTTEKTFDGGFTFSRKEKQSQIDWCLVNKLSLPVINNFRIGRECPKISDHKPIITSVQIDGEKSIDLLVQASKELNQSTANHSKIPLVSEKNTNLLCLDNLMKIEVEKLDATSMSSHDIAEFLFTNIHRTAKISKLPRQRFIQNQYEEIDRNDHYNVLYEKKEQAKWRFVKEHSNDSKGLWNSINYKGEINTKPESDINVNELAEIHSTKSRNDVSQTLFKHISTVADKDITEAEIEGSVSEIEELENKRRYCCRYIEKDFTHHH